MSAGPSAGASEPTHGEPVRPPRQGADVAGARPDPPHDAAFALAERALDAMFTFAGILDADGVLLSANRPPLEAAGLTSDDVLGRPFWETYWWAWSPEVAEDLRRACARARRGESVRYDVRVRLLDDQLLPIDFQVAPVRDDDGAVAYLVVCGEDQSARVEAEQVERRARRRAQALERTASALAPAVTEAEVCDAVVGSLLEVGYGDAAVILPAGGGRFRLAAIGGDGFASSSDLVVDAAVADAYRSGRVVSSDLEAEAHSGRPQLRGVPIPSSTGLDPLGVLVVAERDDVWIDEGRSALTATIAVQVGGALERAALHDRERRARVRADATAAALTALEGADSARSQLHALVSEIVGSIVDLAFIEEPAGDVPLLAAAHRDPTLLDALVTIRRHRVPAAGGSSRMSAIAAGERVLVPDFERDPVDDPVDGTGWRSAAEVESLALTSYAAVPLDIGGGRRAALTVGRDTSSARPLDEEDLEFLDELARRAGLVLAAAHAREHQRSTSLRLQRALLPPSPTEHPDLDAHVVYAAALDELDVGGDWYDTFVWGDGSYGVVVGDVVGHGIEAAASMGRIRAAAGARIASGPPSVPAMLAAVDSAAGGPIGTTYATAFCAVIDTSAGTISYGSAGHPPALLLQSDGAEWLDDATSPPLCGLPVGPRPFATRPLAHDDAVVVYSDGLVERRDVDLEMALEDLMEEASSSHRDADVVALNHRLIDTRPPGNEDDAVVLSLRYRPAEHRWRRRFLANEIDLEQLRDELRGWLAERETVGDRVDLVVLAVSEACSNAIEHAFVTAGDGHVELRAVRTPDLVRISVADTGTWRPPSMALTDRGRGTSIMRSVADRFERRTGSLGTSVMLEFAIGRAGD